jgi:hypothetical protein
MILAKTIPPAVLKENATGLLFVPFGIGHPPLL